jgi:hypothetical protein
MQSKAFSLLDIKAGFYSPLFFMQHAAQAVRAAAELGADPQTTVGKHPADYQLVELGTFDDATGQYVNHPSPIPLGLVASLMRSEAQAKLNIFAQTGAPNSEDANNV